jgi:hypothetical protein
LHLNWPRRAMKPPYRKRLQNRLGFRFAAQL